MKEISPSLRDLPRIQHLEPVTAAENLVGWWTFDEPSNRA